MEQFPDSDKIMLGRGVIANPALVSQLVGRDDFTKDKLLSFHKL